ncbi:hypothetical protein HK405_011923, partial [Cladochytrium tenue]
MDSDAASDLTLSATTLAEKDSPSAHNPPSYHSLLGDRKETGMVTEPEEEIALGQESDSDDPTADPEPQQPAPLAAPARPVVATNGSIAISTVAQRILPSQRPREEVNSVMSDFSVATGAPFKWADPEIFSMSALERFISQLSPHLGGLGNSITVRRLDFRAFDAVSCAHMLHSAVRLCPNLETVLLAFTSSCPNLPTLQYILCGIGASKITGLALHSVGDALEPAPTSEWFGALASNSEGLHQLAQCLAGLDALSIDVRVDALVMQFIASTAGLSLRRFELVNGTDNGNLEMLAAAAVAAAGGPEEAAEPDMPASPDSHRIASPFRETVQPTHVINLLSRAPMLESLNLRGCTALGSSGIATSSDLYVDAILETVAARLPRLRCLRVPGNASPASLTAVLSGCSLLEDLDLGPLPTSSPTSAIRALIDHGHSLRNLAFRYHPPAAAASPSPPQPGGGGSGGGGGAAASTAAAAAAVANAQTLASLELSLAELLDRRGRFLRGLDGLGWPATDRVVRALARHCPGLETLVLFPCSGVRSDAAVRDLVAKCRRLTHLEIRGLPANAGAAAAVEDAVRSVRARNLGAGPAANAARRRLDIARLIL